MSVVVASKRKPVLSERGRFPSNYARWLRKLTRVSKLRSLPRRLQSRDLKLGRDDPSGHTGPSRGSPSPTVTGATTDPKTSMRSIPKTFLMQLFSKPAPTCTAPAPAVRFAVKHLGGVKRLKSVECCSCRRKRASNLMDMHAADAFDVNYRLGIVDSSVRHEGRNTRAGEMGGRITKPLRMMTGIVRPAPSTQPQKAKGFDSDQ